MASESHTPEGPGGIAPTPSVVPHAGTGDSVVTVRDVLSLALPEGTTVVSGAAELGRAVTWARLIRLDRSTLRRPGLARGSREREPADGLPDDSLDERIEPGELALATLPVQAETPHALLARALRMLAARGAAALAIAGPIPAGAQILAETVGTPLLALPAPPVDGGAAGRLADIEKAVISLIVNRRAELEQRGAQIYRRLALHTLENEGIEAIVETLAQITGKPIVLEDAAGPILFSATPAARAISTDDLAVALRDPEGLRPLRGAALSPTSPPVVHRQLAAPGWSRFVAPIVVGGEVTSFLSIVGPDDELDEIDRVAVGRAAAVGAIELAKRQAIRDAEKRIQSDFLDDLLAGRFADEAAIVSRGQPLGFDVTRPYAVVIFDLDTSNAYLEWIASRNEQAIQRLRQVFSRSISDEVARLAPDALLRVDGESATLLLPLGAGGMKAVRAQVEQIRQRATTRLDDVTLSVGIGRHYPDATAAPRAYREAEQALTVARRLYGTNRTTTFDELGIYRLLFHLHGTAELDGFYDETLRSVVEHDERHRSDLIPTLRAFFACHGNLSRTAEALYLHRNTVSYRLQRIEEISNLKLDDEDGRFRLQLALRLLDIV